MLGHPDKSMSYPAGKCLLSLLVLAGCGLAAGRDYSPPLLTLRGTIIATTVPTPDSVHLAVFWKRRDPAGTVLGVFQELTVRAEFPVSFRVDLPGPPPEEAMNAGVSTDRGAASFRFSTGTLLVYDDRSGTGRIELAPPTGTTTDRILGAPERLTIYYLEGTPSRELGAQGVHPGFNLWREPKVSEPAPGAAVCAATPAGSIEMLSLDTDIQIALTADPALTRLICAEDPYGAPDGGSPPLPFVRELTCNADGTAYVIKRCQSPVGLCGAAWCSYQCGSRPAGSPVPSGWPCH